MNIFKYDAIAKAFDESQSNADEFMGIMIDASNNVYDKYTKQETNTIINNLFNKISGFDYKTATPMQRRQDWRDNCKKYYTIIEDVLVDKLNSGWGDDPFFEKFVEERNLALGDKNEFYVEDDSLFQVSKFAGNHHDIDLVSV